GVVGFCWGGGMTNLLASRVPEVRAAAPFYGAAPPADQVAGIKARMYIVFADNDDRINGMWPGYEAALKAARVDYEMHKFPGTQHGFNNDTTPRFDEAAAKVAWGKTEALFNRVLRS
ncbi:MAG TPA: dienelactone hydrolase family protein, partial [Burkholderiaceae bacterium]|nr:dienelactone hydrolase family protein [Burkholderiaceae bacterium]